MTQLHNKKELIQNRKYLRNNSTSAEATLWKYLKGSKLEGRKFRRQHSIENYILDFYCPSERIAIELDGQEHFTGYGLVKDEERDNFLRDKMKVKVLRFENKQVFENINGVLLEIKKNFKDSSN